MKMHENQERYFNKQFPNASDYEIEKLRRDWDKKNEAAEGLVADFRRRAGEPEGKSIVDVGFGNGLILAAFARAGAKVAGVEIDEALLDVARENFSAHGIDGDLRLYDGRTFPFKDGSFDFAFSSSVLEHVSYPVDVLRETYRILKPGGRLYLAFPNKLTPKETHTGLYFISYMPRWLAEKTAHFFGRSSLEEWNLHFLSYWWLVRTLRKNGISFRVLYEKESPSLPKRIFKKSLAGLGIHHSAILSHVMVVMEK